MVLLLPCSENGARKSNHTPLINAERDVVRTRRNYLVMNGCSIKTHVMCPHQEILNHCFDDMERFMLRLQQTAEAQSVLNQRRKKSNRKSKKKDKQEGQNSIYFTSVLTALSSSHSFTKMVFRSALGAKLKSGLLQRSICRVLLNVVGCWRL